MATNQRTMKKKRFPFEGGFFGLLIGLSIAIYLVIFAVVPFEIASLVTVLAVSTGIGVVWGTLAPAKKLDDAPPMNTSLNSTFSRAEGAEDTPAPTYEETFGAPEPPAGVGAGGDGEESKGFFS